MTKDQAMTHQELWQLFVKIGRSIPDCIFIIDGFDECVHINSGVQYHTKDSRSDFLRDLIQNLQKTMSRVLVVSRNVPDIKVYLSKGSANLSTLEMYEYEISAKDTAADVAAFSESMVNQRLPKKNAALKEKIARQAADRSKGVRGQMGINRIIRITSLRVFNSWQRDASYIHRDHCMNA